MANRIKVNVFHNACREVVMSNKADNYAKALAQVGLGLWDGPDIAQQCELLMCNASDTYVRSIFRRYASNK